MWFLIIVTAAGIGVLLWNRSNRKAQERRDQFEREYGE
jgi:hypothetical protein